MSTPPTTKPHRPPPEAGGEPETKRAKPSSEEPSESGAPRRVGLNPADCNLDFDVGGKGLEGHALYESGFAYCWSGARATIGITGGKYCFGCKIISEQQVDMEDTPPDQQHVCRIGISRGDDSVGSLGESDHSFGFGGTGKFSHAGKFSDYGTKFAVGDVIVCAVNLEDKPLASIGFSKNGKWLGRARQFDAGPRGLGIVDSPPSQLGWTRALFPHVLLKNVVVQMQFSTEDGLLPEEGYKPWCSAIEDRNAVIGPSFSKPKECEVLMMVGLPASGKTTWAEKWMKEYPEKRYILLGTNLALEQMKVPGLLRKHNYGERFDRLMDRATGIFNTLLARASKTPRSYIIDQTNVYRSARRRKMREFTEYRKVAVVVFPNPDELKFRSDMRFKEMGKEVPADAVSEMLANYVLPTSKGTPGADEPFDEVIFPELGRAEAQRYLAEMKQAVKPVPNSSRKSECSPYSRESSNQSFSIPSLVSNKAFSDAGGHFPVPDHDFRSYTNQTYGRAGFYGTPERPSGTQQPRISDSGLSIPSASPYGHYSEYGRAHNPIDGQGSYGRYSGSNPNSRASIGRNLFPMDDSSRYQGYGANNSAIHPNFDSPASVDRYNSQDTRYPRCYGSPAAPSGGPRHPGRLDTSINRYRSSPGTPLSYSGPNMHQGDLRVHQADFPPREASYEQPGPLTNTYGSYAVPPSYPRGSRPPVEQWPSQGYPASGAWSR